VQRQRHRLDVGYTALDDGFRACDDPEALQRICDRLGPCAVKTYFWRWQRRLPSPLTRDDLRAGYVYELEFRQTLAVTMFERTGDVPEPPAMITGAN
jgi:hypothetical protein